MPNRIFFNDNFFKIIFLHDYYSFLFYFYKVYYCKTNLYNNKPSLKFNIEESCISYNNNKLFHIKIIHTFVM